MCEQQPLQVASAARSRRQFVKFTARAGLSALAAGFGFSTSAHAADEPLPPNRLDVLATGLAPVTAAEREVCNCNHVTEAVIVDAIREGCDTLPALCNATRAGTGCGSCRGQLAGLLAANVQTA